MLPVASFQIHAQPSLIRTMTVFLASSKIRTSSPPPAVAGALDVVDLIWVPERL